MICSSLKIWDQGLHTFIKVVTIDSVFLHEPKGGRWWRWWRPWIWAWPYYDSVTVLLSGWQLSPLKTAVSKFLRMRLIHCRLGSSQQGATCLYYQICCSLLLVFFLSKGFAFINVDRKFTFVVDHETNSRNKTSGKELRFFEVWEESIQRNPLISLVFES